MARSTIKTELTDYLPNVGTTLTDLLQDIKLTDLEGTHEDVEEFLNEIHELEILLGAIKGYFRGKAMESLLEGKIK